MSTGVLGQTARWEATYYLAKINKILQCDCSEWHLTTKNQKNSPMLVSFQYWAKCSPMDFSKCRYSLASAKSCLLWVGSKIKYGTSTTPTTPPHALTHRDGTTVKHSSSTIKHWISSRCAHITHMPPSSWGPVFSYIFMRREQLYTNIPSRSLWSMFTPNIKFNSLGSFNALKNKKMYKSG